MDEENVLKELEELLAKIDGEQAVIDALREGRTRRAIGLVKKGAPIQGEWKGLGPLTIAAGLDEPEAPELVERMLLQEGERLLAKEETALWMAAKQGHERSLSLIWDHLSPKQRELQGERALMEAIQSSRYETMMSLLDRGVAADRPDRALRVALAAARSISAGEAEWARALGKLGPIKEGQWELAAQSVGMAIERGEQGEASAWIEWIQRSRGEPEAMRALERAIGVVQGRRLERAEDIERPRQKGSAEIWARERLESWEEKRQLGEEARSPSAPKASAPRI